MQQTVTDATGQRRLTTLAYKQSAGVNSGMSIDIEAAIRAAGVDPVLHVTSPRWLASIAFNVSEVRTQKLQVGYDPEEGNLFHGEVWGHTTRDQYKSLSRIATWFVPLEDCELIIT